MIRARTRRAAWLGDLDSVALGSERLGYVVCYLGRHYVEAALLPRCSITASGSTTPAAGMPAGDHSSVVVALGARIAYECTPSKSALAHLVECLVTRRRIVFVVALGLLASSPNHVTAQGTAVIMFGMTVEQVRARFGAPTTVREAGDWLYFSYANPCNKTCEPDDEVSFHQGLVASARLRSASRRLESRLPDWSIPADHPLKSATAKPTDATDAGVGGPEMAPSRDDPPLSDEATPDEAAPPEPSADDGLLPRASAPAAAPRPKRSRAPGKG